MRNVSLSRVTEEVKRICMEASFNLDEEVVSAMSAAAKEEESPLGKEVLSQLVENAGIAAAEKMAMCQDTGIAVFFVEIGEEVSFEGKGLVDAINKGVAQGYEEGYLRHSVVAEPLRERKNTGDNTPAIIHFNIVPGDKFRIVMAAKGTGSENMAAFRTLTPGDGREGVKKFVVDAVKKAGANPCPPIVVGVGIGGNFERSAILAKKALFRSFKDRNPDPYYGDLEDELLRDINNLGIGPQGVGGRTTALAVHVEFAPCHIGSLPVSVNIDCHAHRHKEVVL
ncbi:MAG: fumarate hydratase [Candidatus Eisenbacteria bacterium]|nr:fumarate hydratase [Candidatus Eisenbacteria bacterium]